VFERVKELAFLELFRKINNSRKTKTLKSEGIFLYYNKIFTQSRR